MKTMLSDARDAWKECEDIHGKIRRLSFAGMSGVSGASVYLADLGHNLTLIQAYAALGVALLFKLNREREDRTGLEQLMKESRDNNVVNWVDYVTVDSGRVKRNKMAHRGEWLNRAEVFQYAKVIQEELIQMGIINVPYKFHD